MLNIIHFEKIDSTNNYAKQNVNDIKLDALIIADTQTGGRGRLNHRTWISPIGNFYGTFIFDVFKRNISMNIHSEVLHAILTFMQSIDYKVDANIKATHKAPNDIIVNNKKICGVLIEKDDNHLFVGIGMNLRTSPIDISTNIYDEYGVYVDRLDFGNAIHKSITQVLSCYN